VASVIQLKRKTAAAWTAGNLVLAAGEPGYETDTGKMKIGDGTTAWTSLAYSGAVGGDHGGLAGLTHDDHTHYLLAAGTRALSADWDAGHSRFGHRRSRAT